jgi:excisionase family DNA binding protein
MTEAGGSDLIRPKEAAALVGVSTRTLKNWDDKGYISSLRTPTGHRLYRRRDVLKLLTEDGEVVA